MTTDTSENGLEALIVSQMTGRPGSAPTGTELDDGPEPYVGLHKWLLGNPPDYDRVWTVDLIQMTAFFSAAMNVV